MRIILSSNPYRDRGLRTALEARRILQGAGAETVMCFPFTPRKGERLEIPPQMELKNLEEELARADLLICFGGDGTILHTARDAALHDVPILGVNMGSVGFMAELERGELKLLPKLLQQPFRTQSRMMLEVKTFRGGRQLSEDLALNDAVISKGSMARVAEVEVWADQTALCSLSGDGVVVATPTGSTGYSLSAGGPIVEPTAQNFVISPICAHTVFSKSFVLSAAGTVTVAPADKNRKQVYLSVDGGKAFSLRAGDKVRVSRSRYETELVRLTDRSIYEVLRTKMTGGIGHEE